MENILVPLSSIARHVLLIGFVLLPGSLFAADADLDGYEDVQDAFPNDPAASVDTDGRCAGY